jgi:hypothetical protein
MRQALLKIFRYGYAIFYICFVVLSCRRVDLTDPLLVHPPLCSISASSTSLPFGGGRVTLTWTSQNATSVSIAPDIGIVNTSGDTTIDVKKSTTFILTASNQLSSVVDSVNINVLTTFEFIYPLAIGNQWIYQYHYSYQRSELTPPYSSEHWSIHGKHIWSVKSIDYANNNKICNLINIRHDTTQSGLLMGIQSDSTTFAIIVSKDSIDAAWTDMMLGVGYGKPNNLRYVLRFPVIPHDTVKVAGCATYINKIGLINYSDDFFSMTTQYSESLSLISYMLY